MNTYNQEIQGYIQEAARYPVLSREEEVELFQQYEAGDKSCFERIVKHNLRFVIKIAMKYKNRGLPLSDLIQEGNIGLLEVIDKYDWKKGFRFSTYAAFWIRQAIQIALRKNGSMITLPVRKSRMIGKMSEIISRFVQEHGREPSVAEISRIMDVRESTVHDILRLRESVLSLDSAVDEESLPLMDRLPDTNAESPLEYCMKNQVKVKVAGLLKVLSEKEQRIMRIRFGFEHGKNLSLRKTSRLVGLSQEGVRRIERKALEKLRRPTLKARLAALV